ncbi:hypothetical protein ABI59_23625 [Acidobacteria bacterium Mor1]|nr:hypothetical protein ABI59_23625 [Acidobacteria bacterium Mor1]
MKRGLLLILLLCLGGAAFAADTGSLEGQVTRSGDGVGGVTVLVSEAKEVALTDRNGNYSIQGLAPGTYTVIYTLGSRTVSSTGVVIKAGEATTLDKDVPWEVSLVETLTVYSASRRAERIVEAPQAVTSVSEEEIEQQAAHGQVPKLLEFTPGAEVTQSGLYDYNFNTRGFNSSLNRRVATLIDGRDPSVPFLGAQEWAAVSFPLDDLANLELVRGPSAALYGSNASSGVLNITTKAPRYSQGLTVRLTAGDLDTENADLRFAGKISDRWYFKVTGGQRNSNDFSRSRNGAAEYSVPCSMTQITDCLPQEVLPLQRNDNDIFFGSMRFDHYFNNGDVLTFEGGLADLSGPLFQSGIGRVQLLDVQRTWARVNYTGDSYNILASVNKRDAPMQRSLSSGLNLVLDTNNERLEAQKSFSFGGDRGRFVIGGFHEEEEIDTLDPLTGRQSLVFAPVEADFTGGYSQFDWKFSDRFKLVLAGRYDTSSLHEDRVSPKAALVFTPSENHTVRLTYNEAFQVANYSEFFLQADVAAPVDLSALEAICTGEGVDCGFGNPTRVLAVGNESLDLEDIATAEIGYAGIFGGKVFLTFDIYQSDNENFITDLIPQFDSSGNVTNPNFGAYTPPAALSPTGQATLLGALQANLPPTLLAILSNNLDGSPFFVGRSYKNFGQVDTTGADLGLNIYFNDHWNATVNYSWFDFDLDSTLDFSEQLQPNTPEHKASAGISFTSDEFDISFSGRWSDEFRWVVGPFQGPVEAYETFDLNANYHIDQHWSVGVAVANLFDSDHYEAFGGDILGRRALFNVTYRDE